MAKPTDEGYRESKIFRGGTVKKDKPSPHTVSLVGEKNEVLEEVEVESREAADALVKQKVSHYVEEGWKVSSDDLPSTYTTITKGKKELQFIINECTMKELAEAETDTGEMVSVELHVEFHVSKEQFDSEEEGEVGDAINSIFGEAQRTLGHDLGLEVETHVLTGSYLEPVTKAGEAGLTSDSFPVKVSVTEVNDETGEEKPSRPATVEETEVFRKEFDNIGEKVGERLVEFLMDAGEAMSKVTQPKLKKGWSLMADFEI